jgi:hypothetical protein
MVIALILAFVAVSFFMGILLYSLFMCEDKSNLKKDGTKLKY